MFKIGDTVWFARMGRVEKRIPCPVCYGKREVTIILGNDEHVIVTCDYCAPGYTPPSGFVKEYLMVDTPEERVITSIAISQTIEGEKREYYSDHHPLPMEDIFTTQVEAEVRCAEKRQQHNEEEAHRQQHMIYSGRRKVSWSAGYHLTCAKKAREEMERHERYAVLAKQRKADQ